MHRSQIYIHRNVCSKFISINLLVKIERLHFRMSVVISIDTHSQANNMTLDKSILRTI